MKRRRCIFTGTIIAGLALIAAPASQGADRKPKQANPSATRLPPLPPAAIDNALAIGGDDIAAKKVDTRMTVPVKIDGRGPFRFVVDSGADASVIGLRTAQSLGLAAGTPVTVHGMTGSGRAERVVVPELTLGQSVIRDLQLPILKEDDLGSAGLLGIDALVEQRLMLDFDKKVITIEDARLPPPRLDGDIVVIARLRRGQLILTQASVAGRPVDAVIDTGSEITIGNSALRDRLARGKQLIEVEVTGVTGETVKMPILRLDEVRIGPIVIRDVPIAFYDVPPFTAFALEDRPAMLLGTDLMENFRRISLDFRHRKVRFQLKRCATTGIMVRTTGSASRLSTIDRSSNVCGA